MNFNITEIFLGKYYWVVEKLKNARKVYLSIKSPYNRQFDSFSFELKQIL